jgi:N-acetylmuramoyl-L-alanine amidase
MRRVDNIIIHCTGTPQHTTIASIQRHWREVMKWRSPGYHVIIEANGNTVILAPDSQVCNGVAGQNANSVHVSYIGGVDAQNKPLDNRTAGQRSSLIRVVREWKRKYPAARVRGHNDFAAKACPSFKVIEPDFLIAQ